MCLARSKEETCGVVYPIQATGGLTPKKERPNQKVGKLVLAVLGTYNIAQQINVLFRHFWFVRIFLRFYLACLKATSHETFLKSPRLEKARKRRVYDEAMQVEPSIFLVGYTN